MSTSVEIKTPDPPRYEGLDKTAAFDWILQLETVFELRPVSFAQDRTRSLYLLTLLDGFARAQVSHLRAQDSPILNNWPAFRQEFLRLVGPADPMAEAARKLRRLTQGEKSVAEYAATFRRLASIVGYDERSNMGNASA